MRKPKLTKNFLDADDYTRPVKQKLSSSLVSCDKDINISKYTGYGSRIFQNKSISPKLKRTTYSISSISNSISPKSNCLPIQCKTPANIFISKLSIPLSSQFDPNSNLININFSNKFKNQVAEFWRRVRSKQSIKNLATRQNVNRRKLANNQIKILKKRFPNLIEKEKLVRKQSIESSVESSIEETKIQEKVGDKIIFNDQKQSQKKEGIVDKFIDDVEQLLDADLDEYQYDAKLDTRRKRLLKNEYFQQFLNSHDKNISSTLDKIESKSTIKVKDKLFKILAKREDRKYLESQK